MRFRAALDLGNFNQRFVALTQGRIVGINGLAAKRDVGGKHQAVAQVAVVGNGHTFNAVCALLIQPGPQCAWLNTVEAGERLGGHPAAAEDNVAVQVDFLHGAGGGPFVADQGAEFSGPVVALGAAYILLPDGLAQRLVHQCRHGVVVAQGHQHFQHRGLPPLRVLVSQAGGNRQARQCALRFEQARQYAHVLGVVGNSDEIEWRTQLDGNAADVGDGLSPRKTVGIIGCRPHVEHERVGGVHGVHMELPEERPGTLTGRAGGGLCGVCGGLYQAETQCCAQLQNRSRIGFQGHDGLAAKASLQSSCRGDGGRVPSRGSPCVVCIRGPFLRMMWSTRGIKFHLKLC